MQRNKTRSIFIGTVIAVFAVLIGIFFSVLTKSVNDDIVETNIKSMEELALHDQNSIRNSLNLRLKVIESIAEKLNAGKISDTDELFSEMVKTARSIPTVERLSFLDSDGTEFTSSGLVMKNSYLADVCSGKTGSFIVRLNTSAYIPEMVREVLIEAVPVSFTVGGYAMQWLIAQFPISTLEDELKISSYEGKGYSSVIDRDGNYIINISGPHSFMTRDNFFDDLSGAKFVDYSGIDEVRSTTTTTTTTTGATSVVYELGGEKYIMVITAFDAADWYFITTVPLSVFKAQTRAIVLKYLMLLAVIALFVAIVLILLYRQRRERERLAEQKRRDEELERMKLIEGITAAYNVAYVVNMAEDSFEQLRMDNDMIGHGEAFGTFTQAKEFFIGLLHPADRERMRGRLDYDYIRRRLADSKSFDVEYRVPINGAMIWHTMNVSQIDGDTVTIGFAVDDLGITKKHLEDRRFAEYFALYEIDLDSETVKIVIDSPYYPVSRAGTALPYKATMLAFADTLEGEAREFFTRISDIEIVKKAFATENKYSYSYRSSNVEGKWVDLTSFVTLRHADGTPAMFTLGFSYIDSFGSAKQELKSRLAEQSKELETALAAAQSASRAKTDFLFNMSHDIRTPMNAIKGFTSMAKKYIDDRSAVVGYLDKIDAAGRQLLSLINNVLEMARIEAGRIELDETPVDIRQEFNATVTVLSEQAHMNGQEFNYSLEGIRHFNVYADESKVSSITMNIISNALKYTPEGGRIDFNFREVPARKPGFATFILTVKDSGIGMSREFLDTVFDPFAREKTSTVSGIQGTGLGLAIVKRFIDLMGGEIAVSSEPGKGTRFDVTLDFRIDDQAERNIQAEDLLTVSFEGFRVLLVEDNEMNREIALDILEEEGLKVETAEDGSIAVEMLREKGPDCYDFVLMDIQMPIMNGYEATKAIREMYPDAKLPIIAVSANAFEEDRQKSLEAGMNDHVAKPININELFASLAKFM